MSLPFKISAQSAPVRKAHTRFVQQYGKREGDRIFIAYAEEHGTGSTPRQKAISVFSRGAHIG